MILNFKWYSSSLYALIQSISDINQLKILQQLDSFIRLDKNNARSVNFIFEIKNVALIRSVNLHIVLRWITFHIVSINILFLLCLANIDKCRAFFNNITNQVI